MAGDDCIKRERLRLIDEINMKLAFISGICIMTEKANEHEKHVVNAMWAADTLARECVSIAERLHKLGLREPSTATQSDGGAHV